MGTRNTGGFEVRRTIALAIMLFPALGMGQSRPEDWKVEDRETIRKSFNVSPGSKVEIDNVNGFIHVTAAAGSQVEATIEKRIRAESSDKLAAAKSEVKLDISQHGNTVRMYVDGPFRNKNGDSNYSERRAGYRVEYDYEIHAPAGTELALKGMNGAIVVKGTSGSFDIHGLNGAVDMQEISGSGSAQTVNGPVKVSYASNPKAPSEFHTVNGLVDAYFRPNLNAELQYKTVNGGVYSDFDVTPVAFESSGETSSATVRQRVNGTKNARFLYRSGGAGQQAKVGTGGPMLKFNTGNGAIRLHSGKP